jgi:O-antigen/teichoic acid export membrane protein
MVSSSAGQAALVVSGVGAARVLGVHDRGQLALFALIPLLCTVLGAMGVPVATTFFIARDPANARRIVETVFRFGLLQATILSLVYAVVLVLVYGSSPSDVQVPAAISLILIPCKLALDYGSCILQGQRRYRVFNVTRSSAPFLYAGSVMTLFLLHDGHLLAVTICYVSAYSMMGFATLGIALAGLPPATGTEQGPALGDLVRFGLKAMLGAVYATEAFQLDQAFVGALLSRVELGTYVVGVSFTNLPRFLAQAVGLVAYPQVASVADPVRARRAMWRFVWFSAGVSLLTCGALEVATPALIPFFFGAAFRHSIGVTRLLLISAFIFSVRRVLADGLRGSGFPSLGTAGEISALVALFPTLLVLVPLYGLTGAALSMSVGATAGLAVLLVGAVRTRPAVRRVARQNVDARPDHA